VRDRSSHRDRIVTSEPNRRDAIVERMFDEPKTINLRTLLLHHQEKLISDLNAREVFDHPTARGDIGEDAWHRLLGGFLPRRYQVSKAFVLDARGNRSEQIDLVIHDRHFCPLLFEEGGHRYIPAESVFAVFEIKPQLTRVDIQYAAKKVESVRRLHRTSLPLVDRGEEKPPREPFPIIAGILAVESSWMSPRFGHPLADALEVEDVDERLDLGCAAKHGAFEAIYDGSRPRLEVSEDEGGLMFFLLRLFHGLQRMGSPMAIDLREYSKSLEDSNQASGKVTRE
jgi:hypothetical protein